MLTAQNHQESLFAQVQALNQVKVQLLKRNGYIRFYMKERSSTKKTTENTVTFQAF